MGGGQRTERSFREKGRREGGVRVGDPWPVLWSPILVTMLLLLHREAAFERETLTGPRRGHPASPAQGTLCGPLAQMAPGTCASLSHLRLRPGSLPREGGRGGEWPARDFHKGIL